LSRSPGVLATLRGRPGALAAELLPTAIRTLAGAARRAGLSVRHELSLTLCDNPTIRRINAQWRSLDQPTDVLSFPLYPLRPGKLPPAGAVGDIIISVPYLRRAARELGLPVEDHLTHLLIHGLLHLLGYDHQTDSQFRKMRRAELCLLRREVL
jgi:probable rRNA maturation factor